jgi:hypothetical protein
VLAAIDAGLQAALRSARARRDSRHSDRNAIVTGHT